jgi:hypothetical protein
MTLQTRPGFARLLPPTAIAGLAAGTVLLMARIGPAHAPLCVEEPVVLVACRGDDPWGCGLADAAPAHGIMDAAGRAWDLADIPGHTIRGLHLQNARWREVDLHDTSLIQCDFRGADLRGADFRASCLWGCDFRDAKFDGADFRGTYVTTDTPWPAGFDPFARGARLAGTP